MIAHTDLSEKELIHLLRNRKLVAAGHHQLKIYGTLHCTSGKRMKKANRVFFSSVQEAEREGFRPCGHCMPDSYKAWKSQQEAG